MTTFTDTYINTLLADSSYVDGLLPNQTGAALADAAYADIGPLGDLSFDLKPRMTATLADFIAANFSVLSSVATPRPIGTRQDPQHQT